MEMKNSGYAVLTFFAFIISGCIPFNLPVPDYIDKYLHSASAENCNFITSYKGPNSKKRFIIEPGRETILQIQLRNPKRYTLDPVLKINNASSSASGWLEGSIDENSCSVFYEQNREPGKSLPITAVYEAPDIVRITVGDEDEGDAALPLIGDEIQMHLSLKIKDGGNFNDIFELPVMKCNIDPAGITIMNVSPRRGTDRGLSVFWAQPVLDSNNINDADTLTIICPSLGKTVFSRSFDNQTPGEWDPWEISSGMGSTSSADSIRNTTAFSGISTYQDNSYPITLTLSNADELTATSHFTYNGTSELFFISDNGNGQGFTPEDPIPFLTALSSMNPVNVHTVFVLVDNATMVPFSFPENKTITITSNDSWTLNLGSPQGSLFNIGSGTTLKLGPVGDRKKLIIQGINSNNAALITVSGTGRVEMNKGVVISGNHHTRGTGNGGGVSLTDGGSFSMNGGIIQGNSAAGSGGGVYIHNGTFSFRGSALINPENDVYLAEGKTIHLTGNLSGTGTAATITPQELVPETPVLSGIGVNQFYHRFKISDDSWAIDSQGKLSPR